VEGAIWVDSKYKSIKTELMLAQLEECRSRSQLNTALAAEATKKAEFWDLAIAGVKNRNLVLEIRNSSEPVI